MEATRRTLQDVFVSWLEQRFRDKGKEEIEKMLIGALPDLEETQSGKDLIQIGKSEGKVLGKIEGKMEGKIESLLMLLNTRFGKLPASVLESISRLDNPEQIDDLIGRAIKIDSIDQLLQ